MPAATALSDVPAYGTITITDPGTGPRATWTYDGLLDCGWDVSGTGGVPQTIRVFCTVPQEGGLSLSCPLMVVSRVTLSVVGARAACGSTVDMGVGTSATTTANLGHVYRQIECAAYVDYGVLVPPYTVTCTEPGLPSASLL
jgi:hypothetical protein